MSKLMMLAGGVVDAGGGGLPREVSAYVVLSARASSRIFKVRGPGGSVQVTELPGATTVDLQRFEQEVQEDLQPTVQQLQSRGGIVQVARPSKNWVCGLVRQHLADSEGLKVD